MCWMADQENKLCKFESERACCMSSDGILLFLIVLFRVGGAGGDYLTQNASVAGDRSPSISPPYVRILPSSSYAPR